MHIPGSAVRLDEPSRIAITRRLGDSATRRLGDSATESRPDGVSLSRVEQGTRP
jgi:hypothetical protein